jgi:hypothetical protein
LRGDRIQEQLLYCCPFNTTFLLLPIQHNFFIVANSTQLRQKANNATEAIHSKNLEQSLGNPALKHAM